MHNTHPRMVVCALWYVLLLVCGCCVYVVDAQITDPTAPSRPLFYFTTDDDLCFGFAEALLAGEAETKVTRCYDNKEPGSGGHLRSVVAHPTAGFVYVNTQNGKILRATNNGWGLDMTTDDFTTDSYMALSVRNNLLFSQDPLVAHGIRALRVPSGTGLYFGFYPTTDTPHGITCNDNDNTIAWVTSSDLTGGVPMYQSAMTPSITEVFPNSVAVVYDMRTDYYYILQDNDLSILSSDEPPKSASHGISLPSDAVLVLDPSDTTVLWITSNDNGKLWRVNKKDPLSFVVAEVTIHNAAEAVIPKQIRGLTFVTPTIVAQPPITDGVEALFGDTTPDFVLTNYKDSPDEEQTGIMYSPFSSGASEIAFPEIWDRNSIQEGNVYQVVYATSLTNGSLIVITTKFSPTDEIITEIAPGVEHIVPAKTGKTTLRITSLTDTEEMATEGLSWQLCYINSEAAGKFDIDNRQDTEEGYVRTYTVPRNTGDKLVINVPTIAVVDNMTLPVSQSLTLTRANGELRACVNWEFPPFTYELIYDPDVAVLAGDSSQGDDDSDDTIAIAVSVSVGGAFLCFCFIITIAVFMSLYTIWKHRKGANQLDTVSI